VRVLRGSVYDVAVDLARRLAELWPVDGRDLDGERRRAAIRAGGLRTAIVRSKTTRKSPTRLMTITLRTASVVRLERPNLEHRLAGFAGRCGPV